MPKINVLPREVAELIAAGEVIERPASIVKELIENSIDAGATEITVEIQYGGVRYLRVTDNGCGISAEDAPTAFLRHATSKVQSASDLDRIGTLGFRGEALASIAAVAHVEMLTKTCGAEAGALVKISGSEVEEVSEAGCPDGTTIIVRDVFYNVPARLKFLKKDITESNAVASIVDKIALSHPEISVSFIRDGKQSYRTPGNGDLLGTIYTVLGRDFARAMLPVSYRSGEVSVSGFICRPMSARANRAMQHFFVNGRYTRTRTCGVALEEGYRGAMMVGKFPSCVLMLELPCEMVDVNVHPAKIEVRFVSEKTVFDAVYFAIKSTLMKDGQLGEGKAAGKKENVLNPFSNPEKSEQPSLLLNPKPSDTEHFSTMSAAEYKKAAAEEAPQEKGAKVQLREEWLPRKNRENMLDVEADPADFDDLPKRVSRKDQQETLLRQQFHEKAEKTLPKNDPPKAYTSELPDADELPDDPSVLKFASPHPYQSGTSALKEPFEPKEEPVLIQMPATPQPVREKETPEEKEAPASFEVFGEIFSTYILCRIGEEFAFVDKHAAHERIRYNRLKSQGETLERQMLLSPVTVTLSREEHEFALEHKEALGRLGFEADDFGGSTVAVRSIPALMADASPRDLFLDALSGLMDRHTGVTAVDEILHRMACRSAVKGGDHNTRAELEELVKTIVEDENVRFCPHGRPVLLRFTKRELEKLFGRIQ